MEAIGNKFIGFTHFITDKQHKTLITTHALALLDLVAPVAEFLTSKSDHPIPFI
jgi:hypothetical protein